MSNPTSQPSTNFEEILNIQFEQPSRKRLPAYGLQFVKSFWGNAYGGTDNYFSERNAKFKENEDFAHGKVNHVDFMTRMGVENNKSWNNLDWNLLKIVPRYVQTLIGGFMARDEEPDVTATDILSQEFKSYEKQLAKYRMDNKAKIAEMQAAGGVQLEDGYTPEDEDELDLYYKLKFRLPEEMFFGKTIQEVFQNSDYQNLKRLLLGDLIKKNLCVTKIEKLMGKTRTLANRLRIRWCKPDRTVYNVFESPVGYDVSVIGEAYPIDIAEGRKRFPKITEEEWHKLAEVSSQGKLLINPIGPWQQQYINAFSRPYDTLKFNIFDFEVKVSDKDYYVQTTNQFDKEILIKKEGKPNPQNGETIEDSKLNIYCGVWAIDTDIMLLWEVETDMIRPYQNGVDCFFKYSVVSPDANGTLVPSLLERGTSVVRQMILCSLKIQQMMLEMRPDGTAIDISGLHNLDVGLGEGEELQPMAIKKIYKTTGDILWDSSSTDGMPGHEGKPIPFQNIPNGGNLAQLNVLVMLYNFWLDRLNDEWGLNADALGQKVAARRSNGVNQSQIQAANQATEYIYDFFATIMEQNGTKVAMMLWDMIIFESEDYKNMDGINDNLIEAKFDVNINMIPVNENKARLQQKIDIALEKGTISLGQAIRLENMDNMKDAELYLIKLEKSAEERASLSQTANIQMNAQVQEQSLKTKAQADMMVNQSKAEGDEKVARTNIEGTSFNLIVKMVSDMLIETQKTGVPVPVNMQPFVDYVLQNTIERDKKVSEEEAQEDVAEQQAAQQQDQQQPQDQAA